MGGFVPNTVTIWRPKYRSNVDQKHVVWPKMTSSYMNISSGKDRLRNLSHIKQQKINSTKNKEKKT